MIYFLLSVLFAKEITLSNAYNGSFPVWMRGEGERAVIFVHDDGGSHRNFEGLAKQLAGTRLRTVTFDIDGQGERTRAGVVEPFLYMDLQTIIRELRASGVRDVQCVGAGLGGILCMQALSEETPMSQIAIISPISPVRHLSLFSNIEAYPNFPLFVIAGERDPVALSAILKLEEHRELILLNVYSARRGTMLLMEHPSLDRQLREWILKRSEHMLKRPPVRFDSKVEVKGEKLPF